MVGTSDIKQSSPVEPTDRPVLSKGASLAGKLTSTASSALQDRPALERVASLAATRFLGVDLVDLIEEIDRSDVDLERLGEPGHLEALVKAVSERAGRRGAASSGDQPGRPDAGGRPPGEKASGPAGKAAAAVAGGALLRRLAVPLGVAVAVVVAVAAFRAVRSKRQATPVPPAPSVDGTEPYSVRTEAAMPGAPPSAL
ncbi:MAG TPA: hypothetical protein VFP54_00925 [Acidimicrobiales bacterium]|nr:hypothetical protein [Acidimicrobiales bacterium]